MASVLQYMAKSDIHKAQDAWFSANLQLVSNVLAWASFLTSHTSTEERRKLNTVPRSYYNFL